MFVSAPRSTAPTIPSFRRSGRARSSWTWRLGVVLVLVGQGGWLPTAAQARPTTQAKVTARAKPLRPGAHANQPPSSQPSAPPLGSDEAQAQRVRSERLQAQVSEVRSRSEQYQAAVAQYQARVAAAEQNWRHLTRDLPTDLRHVAAQREATLAGWQGLTGLLSETQQDILYQLWTTDAALLRRPNGARDTGLPEPGRHIKALQADGVPPAAVQASFQALTRALRHLQDFAAWKRQHGPAVRMTWEVLRLRSQALGEAQRSLGRSGNYRHFQNLYGRLPQESDLQRFSSENLVFFGASALTELDEQLDVAGDYVDAYADWCLADRLAGRALPPLNAAGDGINVALENLGNACLEQSVSQDDPTWRAAAIADEWEELKLRVIQYWVLNMRHAIREAIRHPQRAQETYRSHRATLGRVLSAVEKSSSEKLAQCLSAGDERDGLQGQWQRLRTSLSGDGPLP
ncbi:MAG: hypothetical protein VKP62_02055 [Candidatus Sericytochromatia bacterium]|nr:hypothetical protein [Candidatus Sericytochromatia bacterium]